MGPGIARRQGWNLLTCVSAIAEFDLGARSITVERRAEGRVQRVRTTVPRLVTMIEGTNTLQKNRIEVRKF